MFEEDNESRKVVIRPIYIPTEDPTVISLRSWTDSLIISLSLMCAVIYGLIWLRIEVIDRWAGPADGVHEGYIIKVPEYDGDKTVITITDPDNVIVLTKIKSQK
jgi:hypothetical protein